MMNLVRIKNHLRLVICSAVVTMVASTAGGADLPGGITPSDVYAAMDQVNRTMDVLLTASQRRTPATPKNLEVGVHPMHVFQMTVACANRTGEFLAAAGGQPSEPTNVQPKKYSPKDVLEVVESMLAEAQAYGKIQNIDTLPQDRAQFTGKITNEVFELTLEVFIKASTLAGKAKVSPNEVYSQMVVTVEEAKLILEQSGQPFDSDAPAPEPGRKPIDVFVKASQARTAINNIRLALSLDEIPIPVLEDGYRIRPIDVFVQGQILRAELNILKMATGTTGETAQPRPVTGKRPTEVWEQVALIEHLVKQITSDASASVSTE